jgi:poly(A) polymerase
LHPLRFDLPDDVFGPGEKKPQKKAASESAGKGKKRARPAEADDSQLATKRQQTTVATAS